MPAKTAKNLPSALVLGIAACAAGYLLVHALVAQEGPDWNNGLPRQHKSKWLVSDGTRPQPAVVTPGKTPADPPSDAVVLFNLRPAPPPSSTPAASLASGRPTTSCSARPGSRTAR